MDSIRKNSNVCFDVDEALSGASMFKSVIIFSTTEIVNDEEKMIPYLQELINKYRVPETFDKYMSKPGKNQ